jgi:hypothetical protein
MATENAIIERAEMYLRKLSCGINPLTDEILPEGDCCKQERISKCLAYVASLLQQQLNHDQVAPVKAVSVATPRKSTQKAPKTPKQPLSIAPESIGNYRFFDYPVSISRVVRNVNELIPVEMNMNHLLYADVANFLVQQGILSRQMTENGTEANLPTELGETYGFEKGESDLRGHHNIYTQCGKNAQQYILDNLQKCIDIANERFVTREAANSDDTKGNNEDRKSRQKFHVTADELSNYPADETPIPVSEIARRLNSLISPDVERIYYKVIRDWYVSEGYLEFKESPDGKGAFLPTEKGSLAGLMVESRTGKLGELYDVVMYDSKAQRLFLDNIAKD